jgi:hypothetical protein
MIKNFDVQLTKFRSIPFSEDVVRYASGLALVNNDGNCFSSQNFRFTPVCENGANSDRFFYFFSGYDCGFGGCWSASACATATAAAAAAFSANF